MMRKATIALDPMDHAITHEEVWDRAIHEANQRDGLLVHCFVKPGKWLWFQWSSVLVIYYHTTD